MPLFDYLCESCGELSEILIQGQQKAVCPHCGGKKLKKKLPIFAVGKSSPPPPPSSCGSCPSAGAGGCPMAGG